MHPAQPRIDLIVPALDGDALVEVGRRIRETHAVRPIPDELAQVNYFIFIGRLQPADAIDVNLILDDLDGLLPVQFVEGSDRLRSHSTHARA